MNLCDDDISGFCETIRYILLRDILNSIWSGLLLHENSRIIAIEILCINEINILLHLKKYYSVNLEVDKWQVFGFCNYICVFCETTRYTCIASR